MLKSAKLLVATTAHALLVGVAWADNNEVFLDQFGANNSATIDQSSGSDNRAGLRDASNQRIEQDGDRNILTITQSGNSNAIGANGPASVKDVLGDFEQLGNQNLSEIVQSGNDNGLREVRQYSNGTETSQKNALTIVQSGNSNDIKQLRQETLDTADTGNKMTVVMSGTNNRIDEVVQESDSAAGLGGLTATAQNSIFISVSGSDNGRKEQGNWPAGELGGLADVVKANQYSQFGRANTMVVNISGNLNQSGVNQVGEFNNVGTIAISGDGNEIGLQQNGSINTASLSEVSGDYNVIGFVQNGFNNTANSKLGTNSSSNEFRLVQQGNDNTSSLDIVGGGSLNGASVTLSGVAGSLAADTNNDLTNGVVAQWGNTNNASIIIDGNQNAFALEQGLSTASDSMRNSITHEIFGDGNNIAISQTGRRNSAKSKQVGDGNSIAISIQGRRNRSNLVQSGTDNIAELNIDGKKNRSQIRAAGDRNEFFVDISGRNNSANVSANGNDNNLSLIVENSKNTAIINVLEGHSNSIDARQSGSRKTRNSLSVSIYGDNNNFQTSTFTSSALMAFSNAKITAGSEFRAGSIWQSGRKNDVDVSIGTPSINSDFNSFAMLQMGRDNFISGRIEGDNNQIVVSQIGNNNAVTFSQIGSFNNTGITQ